MSEILNQAKFTMSTVGEVSGLTYAGEFSIKIRLSHRDTLKMDSIRRDLLGDFSEGASSDAIDLANVIAFLGVHVLSAPSWWRDAGNGLDLEDGNVLKSVIEGIRKIKEADQKDRDQRTQKAKEDLAAIKPGK
jgi:hypothetical protein